MTSCANLETFEGAGIAPGRVAVSGWRTRCRGFRGVGYNDRERTAAKMAAYVVGLVVVVAWWQRNSRGGARRGGADGDTA